MKTAIFVDVAFVIGRLRQHFNDDHHHAIRMTENIMQLALKHLQADDELYRIYCYDGLPIDKKVHKPISREMVDLSKSKEALFRKELHSLLNREAKTQLRMSELSIGSDIWRLKNGVIKELMWSKKQWYDLTDNDFVLDTHQKGLGVQLGADLMNLALKNQVDKIVLITNDESIRLIADKVRHEGVHLVLDVMQKNVDEKWFEHVDECWTTFHPKKRY